MMKASLDIPDDLAESSKQRWFELIPKAEIIASKESETRPAVKDLLKKQKDELDLYQDCEESESGMLIQAPYYYVNPIIPVYNTLATYTS